MSYPLPAPMYGYEEGTVLRDVPLREARVMECNRCGDCCDGTRPDVKKDEATGLPLLVWGSKYPEDLYESRYGVPLLMPIVMGDGGIDIGREFERDADDKPYTAFKCAALREDGDGCTTCGLVANNPRPDPQKPEDNRPLNCGDFPVFGIGVDDAVIETGYFIPGTGPLPRCTWHGIRVTGPWKDTPNWRSRFEAQARGEAVPSMALPAEKVAALVARLKAKRQHTSLEATDG